MEGWISLPSSPPPLPLPPSLSFSLSLSCPSLRAFRIHLHSYLIEISHSFSVFIIDRFSSPHNDLPMAHLSIDVTRSIVSLLLLPLVFSGRHSELDETVSKVECLECVVTWSSSTHYSAAPKCAQARTCTGNACFMRQCKHCPVYQYMMGCLSLSRWQTEDIEFAKKEVEQRASRIGAVLLCEDSFNQTTCICNRRDKCNSLHLNLPFSTYAEGFFTGIVNFDVIIGRIDPNYFSIIPGTQRHSPHHLTSSSFLPSFSLLYIAFLLFW